MSNQKMFELYSLHFQLLHQYYLHFQLQLLSLSDYLFVHSNRMFHLLVHYMFHHYMYMLSYMYSQYISHMLLLMLHSLHLVSNLHHLHPFLFHHLLPYTIYTYILFCLVLEELPQQLSSLQLMLLFHSYLLNS